MKPTASCKLCASPNTFDFFQLPPVPTQDGVMGATANDAIHVEKGRIDLRFCRNCGFIRNEGYDPAKISFDDYDFSNDHSPLFRAYVNDLADRLIGQYNLKGKTILDIGSGDGIFLQTLCEKGDNKGIGIDPGFDLSKRKFSEDQDITFIRDYYSEKYADLKPDFVACRLVLDLLDDQTSFLKMLRKNLENSPGTVVYFEVPNALFTFEDKVIWNVVYEHGAWYTPDSFAYQFERCGFEVLNVEPCWKGELLGIEARPRAMDKPATLPPAKNIEGLANVIEDFNLDFQNLMNDCEAKIEQIKKQRTKTLAWGAGARAVTFFNLFDMLEDVPFIVDINTQRQGKYLPGSAQEIVAPEFIVSYQPELVIITNPTYEKEIKAQIEGLGVEVAYWIL